MDVKQKVVVKGKNVPIFIEGEAPGVIAYQIVKVPDNPEPIDLIGLHDKGDQLLKDCVQVVVDFPTEEADLNRSNNTEHTCCGVSVEEHTCPYLEELKGDYESLCTCCEQCTYECSNVLEIFKILKNQKTK